MANDKKSELLGLNFSSASSALRKQIIFHLAGALDLLSCYRCGMIVELENFSIDHKDSWMQAEDPKQSFFDMNNIAFSHIVCNSGANTGGGKSSVIKENCPQGHPYNEDNTRIRPNGWRECKICISIRNQNKRKTIEYKDYRKQYMAKYQPKYRARVAQSVVASA